MTTESTMTTAATTTEGQASQDATNVAAAVAAPAAAPAAAAPAASTQQQATEGQTSAPGETGNAGEQAKGDQAKPAVAAPEKYEFKMPEGVELGDKGIAAFSEVAKELNLPQDAAQKVLDKMGPVINAQRVESVAKAKAQWIESSKTDAEFGGEKLAENLAVAKQALDTFGSPELSKLLSESGLGNHPELIRAFYRAGKAISQDKFVPAGTGGSSGARDAAATLFPNQKH